MQLLTMPIYHAKSLEGNVPCVMRPEVLLRQVDVNVIVEPQVREDVHFSAGCFINIDSLRTMHLGNLTLWEMYKNINYTIHVE
jgi:molybdenum cofactor biosynthesis enzyme